VQCKIIYAPAMSTNTMISRALATGQQNYCKNFTNNGRISFA